MPDIGDLVKELVDDNLKFQLLIASINVKVNFYIKRE